jgi:hypothetical protein
MKNLTIQLTLFKNKTAVSESNDKFQLTNA